MAGILSTLHNVETNAVNLVRVKRDLHQELESLERQLLGMGVTEEFMATLFGGVRVCDAFREGGISSERFESIIEKISAVLGKKAIEGIFFDEVIWEYVDGKPIRIGIDCISAISQVMIPSLYRGRVINGDEAVIEGESRRKYVRRVYMVTMEEYGLLCDKMELSAGKEDLAGIGVCVFEKEEIVTDM